MSQALEPRLIRRPRWDVTPRCVYCNEPLRGAQRLTCGECGPRWRRMAFWWREELDRYFEDPAVMNHYLARLRAWKEGLPHGYRSA